MEDIVGIIVRDEVRGEEGFLTWGRTHDPVDPSGLIAQLHRVLPKRGFLAITDIEVCWSLDRVAGFAYFYEALAAYSAELAHKNVRRVLKKLARDDDAFAKSLWQLGGRLRDNNDPARIATVAISILFAHPTIDPAVITRTLRLGPTTEWHAGERRRRLDGRLGARAYETRWSYWRYYFDERAPRFDQPLPDINGHLVTFLEPFVREAAFVRTLTSDGCGNVDLNLPGQFHLGILLEPEVLQTLVELGLRLGVEVFPNASMTGDRH